MDYQAGQRVMVLEHWRHIGKVGGWGDWEQECEIVRVNRKTAVVRRAFSDRSISSMVRTVPKKRILRLAN